MEFSLIQHWFSTPDHTIKDFFELYKGLENETVTINGSDMLYVEEPVTDNSFRIKIPNWFVAINYKNIDLDTKSLYVNFQTNNGEK